MRLIARLWVALCLTALALVAGAGSAAGAAQSEDRVVVFGVPGLRWSDVSATATPAIWDVLEGGAAAAMSVRTVRPSGCPIDGWLTFGAGVRATAPRPGGACLPTPVPAGEPGGAAVVPGFPEIVEENAGYSYDPRFGLLAEEVRAAGGCLTAAGPGAATAAADASGQVERYVADPGGLGPAGAPAACEVTVVDLGTVPDGQPERREFLGQADREIRRISGGLSAETTVIVAGLGERSARPHLGALVMSGPGYDGGWLTATSTRHPGLVQLTDLAPTVLAAVGLAVPDSMVGSVMETAGGRPHNVDVAWQRLAQQDVAAATIRDYAGIFFVLLELGQILLYAIVGWALWRRRRSQPRLLYLGALFVGSAPAASFLANLVPWWRAVHPAPALGGLVLGWTVALTAAAVTGPWRRWHLLGPAGFIAAVTGAVLAVDVSAGGSRLQLSSLYGLSPLIAGRFYGFGNVAFAVFAMTSLFAALAAAAFWLARGNRRAAIASVVVIGLVAVLADGWPSWGSDFGGVLAMVPGFALLAFAAAGIRPTARLLLGVAAGAIAAVSALAWLDWLRPAEQRSHLGRFVQDLVDGEAGDIVQRKIDANLATFTRGPEGILVPLILLAIGYLLARPERLRTFHDALVQVPILRPGLVAIYVTAVLGFAVNDSGIQVSAVCLVVATPLVVASCARLLSQRARGDPQSPRLVA